MATKQLYIRDEDAPIWERAAALADGDSLSAVVVKALRHWADVQEAQAEGFEPRQIDRRNKPPLRFIGRELASHLNKGTGVENTIRIWQTRGGRIVYEFEHYTIWEGKDSYTIAESFANIDNAEAEFSMGDGECDVEYGAPGSLFVEAREALGQDTAEWVD